MSKQRHNGTRRELTWFKSSYSGTNGGDCVEVAVSSSTVHVRDSKNVAQAPFSVEAGSWSRFVRFVAQA